MPRRQIWMLERLFDRQTLTGIEHEQAGEHVEAQIAPVRIQMVERDPSSYRERLNVLDRLLFA